MNEPDPSVLAAAVRTGDRRALARAITLIESTRRTHHESGARLIELLAAHAGESLRVGISGAPGVGKSTFIEALGQRIIADGHRIAVLAVDPSSARSGGSILGDKTRMQELARDERAFIRPSPAGATLGGVTRRTRESILACEAAGFDVIIVETVGVGQSEAEIASMTDLFLLLLQPAGGDELQGIKRGIVELADVVIVNKADGELAAAAGRSAADYRNALRLARPRSPNWSTPVETCSALHGTGLDEIWMLVKAYREQLGASGEIDQRRAEQARAWLRAEIAALLMDALRDDAWAQARLCEFENAVAARELPPTVAATRLVGEFLARQNREAREK